MVNKKNKPDPIPERNVEEGRTKGPDANARAEADQDAATLLAGQEKISPLTADSQIQSEVRHIIELAGGLENLGYMILGALKDPNSGSSNRLLAVRNNMRNIINAELSKVDPDAKPGMDPRKYKDGTTQLIVDRILGPVERATELLNSGLTKEKLLQALRIPD